MNRKLVFILFLLVLLSPMIRLTFIFEIDVEATNGHSIHNRDTGLNYTTIQAAINANETEDGHRILVDGNCTYHEHVIVNKSISLFGQERRTAIIDGSGTGTAVTITKSNVNVTEFTIQNSAGYSYAGIYLNNVSLCNITENTVLNNYYGIHLDRSSNNTISGNRFSGCGLHVSESYSNVIVGNTVNGKPLVYLEDASDLVVNDAGQVILAGCNNISVENLTLSNTTTGIEMRKTNNTKITRNNITNNKNGIHLYESSHNNTILGNNVTNNYYGINLYVSSYNNTILGNNVTNNYYGIRVYDSLNNTISGNTVTTNHEYGISVNASFNNTISENSVTTNSWDGIRLHSSSNNTISGNAITTNHEFGIRFESSSCNNIVSGNNIANNWDGIDLYGSSCNNTISGNTVTANLDDGICLRESHCNSITENNIISHDIGIYLAGSLDNLICHNNFVNNFDQVASYQSANSWNDSYPSGGNYWSDYHGADTNYDGIGDSWYEIDDNNTDHYPLMGMFSSFNTSLGDVYTICNSTISDFQCYFDSENQTNVIRFNVSGTKGTGFCRICIPHTIFNETYTVLVDGDEPDYVNYALCDNSTHRWIHFTYQHSIHEVIIIPEFPSFLILPLFIITTLLAVMVYKKEHQTWNKKREV
jgi:parallel beta-helix repeat protein